jgi:putative spermidine/putrescine transport system permease protein
LNFAALIAPAGLLVTAMLGVPMILLARISLDQFSWKDAIHEALTPENYVHAVSDPYYQQVLLTTIVVSLGATAIATALGFPAAYWIARLDSRFKSLIVIVTLFPLLVGNVVRSAGWMAILERGGALNWSLRLLGIIDAPLDLSYSWVAVIIGLVGVVLPYVILSLAAAIEAIPRHLEEAAANLGAAPLVKFSHVVLPLSIPGIVASSMLTFILCMNAYATPVLLGGPRFKMMAPAIYDQFTRNTNWPFGAALAFILLFVTLVMTSIGNFVLSRRYVAK